MIRIKLQRILETEEAMLGHISLPEMSPIWSGYTVERPWKDNEPYVSCIPPGVYKAFTRVSPSNGNVIELIGVPGRTFIQLHVANWAWQLEGCVGVGLTRKVDGVGRSWDAMQDLYALCLGQEIEIEVLAPPHLPERQGDEIEWAGKVTPEEMPTTEVEMPQEWLEPVNYKKALQSFVGKIRRDLLRKRVLAVVFSLVGLVLSIRHPALHRVQTAIRLLYEFITTTKNNKPKVNNMPENKTTLTWVKARLKEPTTWAGIVTLLGVLGFAVSPELIQAISAAVASIIGVILVISKQRKVKEEYLEPEE